MSQTGELPDYRRVLKVLRLLWLIIDLKKLYQ